MPRKKKVEVTSEEEQKEKRKIDVSGVFMGTGRRKTAVARVWIRKGKEPI